MSNKQSHLTHRTPKYRPLTRLTASTIALAVLISPLELPIHHLVSQPEDFFVDFAYTAKESYEDAKEAESVTAAGGNTVTFTRGEGSLDHPYFDAPAPAAISYPLSDLVPPQLDIEESPEFKRLVQNSKRGENVLAAIAIASGDTMSELASVDLDVEGNITKITDLHGSVKQAEYDEAGRPVRITNADGSESYYSYNQKGQLTNVSHTPPEMVRGPLMSILASIVSPLFALADEESNASFFYEANNIAEVHDSTGAISYEYDEEGLLTSETYSDGSGIEYGYDDLGNLISSEEFASSDTKLSLASFLRMSYASPVSTYFTEESSYNDNNQLSQYTLTEVSEVSVPVIESEAGSVTKDTTSIPNPEIVSSTTEPALIEVVPETSSNTESSVQLVPTVIEEAVLEVTEAITAYLSSAYSALALWLDTSLNRAWAEVAVVAEVIATPDVASSSKTLYGISFTYDAQGNVIESRTTAGVVTTYSYNSKTDALIEKVVTTAQGVVDRQTYDVDEQARITSHNEVAYGFTDGGMLTSVGANQYRYDEYGNRSAQTGANAASFTYSGNRLLQAAYDSGRVASYAYDERGAVSAVNDSVEGVTEFTYTPSGAVESISQNGVTVAYTYDALGRRVSRTSSTDGTWTYEYNGTLLKRVVDSNEVSLREYFYTPAGELTAVRANDTLYHVVTNGNKSVTALVNTTTGESYKQSYDAWGAVVSSNFPITLDIGYIGAFVEAGFGVSVFGPRVYDPELGRFLSKDPLPGVLLDGLSQNEYIYAKNDPIHQYDPSGHASEIAQKSTSPKRALVETETALELLRNDETQAKAAYNALLNNSEAEVIDVAAHQTKTMRAAAALEATQSAVASLEVLYSLQVQAIEENEAEAAAEADDALTIAVGGVQPVAAAFEDVATSSMSVVETTATTSVQVVTFSLPVLDVVAEPEPIASTIEVSTTMFGSVLAVASAVFGDYVLKAEAKKKKKKSKNKKEKKKSSKKAKEKQKKDAKKLAKMKKQIDTMQKQLLAMKAVVDKRVEAEKIARQQASNALRNIEATNAAQVAKLNLAPAKPATTFTSSTGTCGVIMSCASNSAGITAPLLSYHPTQSFSVSKFFTTQNAHYFLTACGFEQTVIGATCGVADAIIYATEGKWLDVSLSGGAAIPFIGAAGDVTKAAKLTAEAVVASKVGIAGVIKSGELIFSSKIEDQLVIRGWSTLSVKSLIDNPYTTRVATNKASGNPATVFYAKNGTYVSVDNVTKEVIQVTDNSKVLIDDWFPDNSIINPYVPAK